MELPYVVTVKGEALAAFKDQEEAVQYAEKILVVKYLPTKPLKWMEVRSLTHAVSLKDKVVAVFADEEEANEYKAKVGGETIHIQHEDIG